jgi:hypothetical protein
MADDDTQNTGADAEAAREEAARERREKQNVIETLRKRDAKIRQQDESISALQARLDRLEESRQEPTKRPAAAVAVNGEDPEPNRNDEPLEWLAWCRREDKREAARERQQGDWQNLNTFAVNSEQFARDKEPHYDEAREYLRSHYRDELEGTGELEEAGLRLLQMAQNDKTGQTRQQLNARMAEKGLSELEAAKDWCFDAAFESRRMETVKAQLRKGGNPALKMVDLAKQRGWKPGTQYRGAGLGAEDKNNRGSTGVLVDDAMKELDRRKRLRAGTETVADVRDGGEVSEKRTYTRQQLDELRNSNPAEYKRAIQEIVAASEEDPSAHHGIITR